MQRGLAPNHTPEPALFLLVRQFQPLDEAKVGQKNSYWGWVGAVFVVLRWSMLVVVDRGAVL